MEELAIDVVQLSLSFKENEYVFKDLSFQIQKGEIVAIIGPNGSGKTSLIKTIMGLYKPFSGHVHLYEPKVGYVPQHIDRDQFSPMTVREFISLKLPEVSFWNISHKHDQKMREILSKTRLESELDQQIKYLSGGQFQRLMIAYAIIQNPGLLILDEPVSGVDIHGEQDFFELIEDIHKSYNMTILMISHDIDIVYRYASQVICLNKYLICQGAPIDVLTKKTIEETFSSKHSLYHHQHKAKEKK